MIPETANRPDWPRLVKGAFERLKRTKLEAADLAPLEGRVGALEARYSAFGDYADDTAAAAAGVPVGGFYHTTGAVKVRVV